MSRTTTSRLAAVGGLTLTAALTGLVLAPSASAEEFASVTLSATTVAPGEEFTISGTGCISEDEDYDALVIVMDEDGAIDEALEPQANGSWSITTSFPAGTAEGESLMVAACDWYTGGGAYSDWTMTIAADSEGVGAIRGVAANTPGTAPLTTDRTTGNTSAPGQKVVKVIGGFQPFERVTLVMHSTPTVLGTFTADANGVVTAEFTLPAGTPAGTHTLVFDGEVTYYQESLEVTGGIATAGTAKHLAYTGADIVVPLTVGGALVLAGAGAIVVSRRRPAGAPQA
jgi:hypothetical protein